MGVCGIKLNALVLVLLENTSKYDVNNSVSAYTVLNNSTKTGERIMSKSTTDSCMDNDDNGHKSDDDSYDNYAEERIKEIKRERYARTPHHACVCLYVVQVMDFDIIRTICDTHMCVPE